MVGDHQGNRVLAEIVRASAKLAQTLIAVEQYLGCKTAHGHDNSRPNQIDLSVEERTALPDLLPEGITVIRGAALEHIGDVDIVTRQADAAEHGTQQDPRSADEGQSLLVFLCARGFSDEKPAHGRLPGTENDLAPGSMEFATLTAIGLPGERSEISHTVIPAVVAAGRFPIGLACACVGVSAAETPSGQPHFPKIRPLAIHEADSDRLAALRVETLGAGLKFIDAIDVGFYRGHNDVSISALSVHDTTIFLQSDTHLALGIRARRDRID